MAADTLQMQMHEATAMNTLGLDAYLHATDVIDWQHPTIVAQARTLARSAESQLAIAHACFEWVRDTIRHSVDYQLNPVTCNASDVLNHGTGYCYAKSHLLAALLRANGIPAGFCYQRLSFDDTGAPYCLHGLNGVYLPELGWYRVDARGNRADVNAQFTPPHEQLAYPIRWPEEADFPAILPEPLPVVIHTLQTYSTWHTVREHLPDISLDQAQRLGLR